MTDDGTIEQRDGRVVFRYQRELHHPIDRVWRAITDPDELAQWLGNRPELELRVGGRYVMMHTSPDGSTAQRVEDRVVAVAAPRLFQHTFWQELNPSALVTWELTATERGTRLELTHELDRADVESVAGQESIVTIIARNAAGWHRLLDQITALVDGAEQPWTLPAHQDLRQRYAALVS
jgi:uncharacterized protein YndB with AHSA1/START domain